MKLKSRIPYWRLIVSALVLQLLSIGFVYFRESYLLDAVQFFLWFALAMIAYLVFKQNNGVWGGKPATSPKPFLIRALKTTALFIFVLFFSWQIYYLSLYESQPLMMTADHEPLRYDMLAGDMLGYTLRMVLQTWLLALALALVLNKIPRNGEYGFLRGNYKKLSTLAWYVGNMLGGGVSIFVLLSLGLLTLDTSKFIAKSFGADIMVLPQFDLVVFLFSLYIFNLATGFTKKLKAWGEDPSTSLMFIVLIQLLFVLVVYCLTRVMMHFMSEETIYALMEPFYFDFIDYTIFPQYWQLFVAGLSLFMVPLLAHYFYHALQGEALKQSVLRLLVIPIGLCLGLTQLIPSVRGVFFDFLPKLSMQPVLLNDVTTRYEISWVSYFSVLLLIALMLFLQRSKILVQSLVDVMPEHVGRRVRRVKALYSRTYTFLLTLLMMYLLAGVVVSLYFSSLFLMATLLGLGLCFVAGLKQEA